MKSNKKWNKNDYSGFLNLVILTMLISVPVFRALLKQANLWGVNEDAPLSESFARMIVTLLAFYFIAEKTGLVLIKGYAKLKERREKDGT